MIYLFVDLDRTLINCTSSKREFSLFIKDKGVFKGITHLTVNRCFSKLKIKSAISFFDYQIDYSKCINQEVMSYILDFKKNGYKIVLATGAMSNSARKIAESIDFIDEVIGSTAVINLKGVKKLSGIEEMVGTNPFIYMGDSRHDFAVFSRADIAFLVTNSHILKFLATIKFRNKVRFLKSGRCIHG